MRLTLPLQKTMTMKISELRNYLLLFLALLPVAAQATGKVDDEFRQTVERIAAGEQLQLAGSPIASVIVLPALYEKYAYQPIWRNPDSVAQLVAAIDAVQRTITRPARKVKWAL